MRLLRRITRLAVVAAVAALAVAPGAAPARAEVVELRAISMFPESIVYTQSFQGFIRRANGAGAGVFKIRFAGGPEGIPVSEQPEALRTGVVDILYGPASYYPGEVPEGDALIGSDLTPMDQRANGALELMDDIHRKKLNAHYLAHIDGGVQFHIYLREAPPRTPDGGVDLSGLRLRAGPFYREFFTSMGAVHVGIPVPDVYTALQRGAVDGVGWTSIGVMDLGWDQYLRVRVDPGFSQTDLGILVNLDKWNAIGERAQRILRNVAVAYEKETYDRLTRLATIDDLEMRRRGVEVIKLQGAAADKYLATAYDSIWRRLKARDGEYYQDLRARFLSRPE